eukprot:GHRR01037419.1.p1 GENE.GHRR01037419.1~~GHRR01037419.1.p1  ORF type:complete len:132 (-),score=25.95 GHRR01037419.1:177-572(-)
MSAAAKHQQLAGCAWLTFAFGYHCRFHEIEPQLGLGLMPPHHVSRAVVCGGARRVPWPRLGENTLLLADELVLTQAPGGRWFVAVRCAEKWFCFQCPGSAYCMWSQLVSHLYCHIPSITASIVLLHKLSSG